MWNKLILTVATDFVIMLPLMHHLLCAETLPLVSLLWLVSILCLFLVDDMPNRSLVAPRSLERDLVKLARTSINGVKMTRMTSNGDNPGALGLIRLGRCCRGTRARIKSPWVPWHAAAAC